VRPACRKNHSIKIGTKPFGMVEQLKYFDTRIQIEVSLTKKLSAD
jgi:hypothetical protein